VAVGLIAVLLAAACGSDEARVREPDALLAEVVERLAAAETFRFQVSYEGPAVIAEAGAVLDRVDGVFQAPDRAQSVIRLSALGLIAELEIVSEGSEVWRRGPFNDVWEPMEGDLITAGDLFSDGGLLTLLRSDVTGLVAGETVSLEPFPGEEFELAVGSVAGERLGLLTLGYLQGDSAQITLFATGPELRRIELVEVDVDEPRRWIIDLWDYDAPVDIERP